MIIWLVDISVETFLTYNDRNLALVRSVDSFHYWLCLAALPCLKLTMDFNCFLREFKRNTRYDRPVYVLRDTMNFSTVQPPWFAYQTVLNQSMASEYPAVIQESTAGQYIDLETVGKQPILRQCLAENYSQQNDVFYPNYENNLTETTSQEAMICLTEFGKHTNGELFV